MDVSDWVNSSEEYPHLLHVCLLFLAGERKMAGFFSYMKRSSISHLLLAITFFVSGLIINLAQAILYCSLRPFSKYLYRKINYYICYSLYCQLVFMAEWWSSSELTVYIDKEDLKKYYGKEHGYLLMNHRYEVDWLMGWVLCDRVNILGNCKAYAKKSIKYVPTMGWAWFFAETIFLERNWEKDKDIIGRQTKELMDYPDPVWLLLMAEGTRFTEEKHEASKKFAEENNLPVLKHHLTPRTKGFLTSLPHLREKCGAIYEVQLTFKEGERPTMTDLLLGKKVQAHLYMNRIPLDEVPEDEEGVVKWLYQLYEKKDRLSDSFYRTGDFFAESGVKKVEGIQLPRRYYSLLNTVTWGFVVVVPMMYYLFRLLTSGSTLYMSLGIGIIGIFFWLMSKMIGLTKISKASSYGKTTTTPTETKDIPSATKKTE